MIDVKIHLKKPGVKTPKGTCYVVAKNGAFIKREEWWARAIVPAKRIVGLDEEQTSFQLLLPPFPALELAKAHKFFRQTYIRFGSEACVLFYHTVDGYKIHVPQQCVDAGGVECDTSEVLPGDVCGSIHSHVGGVKAYHSIVDQQDEEYWDGVHITLGVITTRQDFSLSVQAVVNGHRFPVDMDWTQGLVPVKNGRFVIDCPEIENWVIPEEWTERVHPFPNDANFISFKEIKKPPKPRKEGP